MFIYFICLLSFMNKRLREKLAKEGRLDNRVHFLKNSATFFCGEKRLVELYLALRDMNPEHPLLNHGSVHDGRFRFYHDYQAPEHLKNKPVVQGIPLSAQHSLHYMDQLLHALI